MRLKTNTLVVTVYKTKWIFAHHYTMLPSKNEYQLNEGLNIYDYIALLRNDYVQRCYYPECLMMIMLEPSK